MQSPSKPPTNGAESPTKLPHIQVTFHADGNLELHTEGVGPPQLWAAARMIELWGDSEFAAQQMKIANKSGIVTPGGSPRLGRIGS